MNQYEELKFGKDSNKTHYILMAPTVDYGKIPPNGEKFLEYLESLTPSNQFAHMKIAMFGLGDSEYPQYQLISKRIFEILKNCGAKEFAPFVRADEEY